MKPEEEENVEILEDIDTVELLTEDQKNAKTLVCLRCPCKILPKNIGSNFTIFDRKNF